MSIKLTGLKQTKYRADIHAAIKAIEQAIEQNAAKLTIFTDSKYLVDCIKKNTNPKENKTDLECLEKLISRIQINCVT